jgi:hypothetical protein
MASSLQQGINAAKTGHMQEALEFLKDAIIEEPQNADVWVWIAAIIDDPAKQEIFLLKAIDIDPGNVPAQRGLDYLQKRKADEISVKDEHLSDHTQPISPFPASQKGKQKASPQWSKISDDEIEQIVEPEAVIEKPQKAKKVRNRPKLSLFEITLLGVVVVVFCFIGLLAASSIFKFELPLDFFMEDILSISTDPPYPGVFLFENDRFFDIQQYEGVPDSDLGMPTSFASQPIIVFFETLTYPEELNLIYETGEYVKFKLNPGLESAVLTQPEQVIQPGLYCFQQLAPQGEMESLYWCFKVAQKPTFE